MAFKDALAEKRNTLVRSNHDNLSQAYLYVEEEIRELEKKIVKGKELLADIEKAADTPEILQDASGIETNRLYNRMRSYCN